MRIELCSALQEAKALANALGALWQGEDLRITGISTDSREVMPGDLFVALQGKRQNGSVFVPEAKKRGAVAVLAQKNADFSYRLPTFLVDDPIAAIQQAAHLYRKRCNAFCVAISGSAGKTTVKDATAVMLQAVGCVSASLQNFNSTLGAPLSMLSFQGEGLWVVELGINHPGEMERLSRLCCPDLAVLTNVGQAHIGQYRDQRQLLEEKAKIVLGLSASGRALIPASLSKADFPCTSDRIFRFGVGGDFCLEKIVKHAKGVTGDLKAKDRVITNLGWPIAGQSGVAVLETVGAIGVLLGLSNEQIQSGIGRATLFAQRMQCRNAGKYWVIDDGYNASPESMAEALSVLKACAEDAPTVAVLGDMLELGAHSKRLHAFVGERVIEQQIDLLLTYGELAKGIADRAIELGFCKEKVCSFLKGEEKQLLSVLLDRAPAGAYVLFKASGGMQISRLAGEVKKANDR